MKTKLLTLLIVFGILLILFGISLVFPLIVIWIIKELFNLDYSNKYWAIWVLIMILGFIINIRIRIPNDK